MKDLATQYLDTAQNLKLRIEELAGEKKKLEGDEYFNAMRRIDILRAEYYHSLAIGRHLYRQYGER